MSDYPAARRKDHLAFVTIEGWNAVHRATGGGVRHHPTFELGLPDGRVLRTHISNPPDSTDTYSRRLFAHILRDQLEVSEAEFWACVQRRTLPERGAAPPPRDTLPAGLVHQLLTHGVTQDRLASMSRQEALQALTDIWSRPDQ